MWAKGAKYSFCNTAHTKIRLMKLFKNLNEVMGNSLIKSKIGCHGNELDKIMSKYGIFQKSLNLTHFWK